MESVELVVVNVVGGLKSAKSVESVELVVVNVVGAVKTAKSVDSVELEEPDKERCWGSEICIVGGIRRVGRGERCWGM